ALGVEAAVGAEGAAEVAGADEQDVPHLVRAEDAFDLEDEVVHAVADAGVAELAEVGEVLADLGIGEAEALAELAAGDRAAVLALERLELPQVEAEPADGGIGDQVRPQVGAWVGPWVGPSLDCLGIELGGTGQWRRRLIG